MVYLMCKGRGQSMNEFLSYFTVSDYVQNGHIVGSMLEDMIQGLIKYIFNNIFLIKYHFCV